MLPKIEIGPIVKVVKTDEEWKNILAPEAYRVLRHEDTKRPFINNCTAPLNLWTDHFSFVTGLLVKDSIASEAPFPKGYR